MPAVSLARAKLIVSEAALKREGVEEERQAVCTRCEKWHREEIQQFLHYKKKQKRL